MSLHADNCGSRSSLPTVLLFMVLTVAGTLDLVLDAPESWLSFHFFLDLSFVLLCLGVTGYLWRGWHGTRRALASIERVLEERQEERDAWRESSRRLRDGLGAAIDAQLRAWSLTQVERQTAFLLLKGYSHKEIASLTERSERTVRQHAVDIYRKSGLGGRAELSAFFLEDMLPPLEDEPPRPGDSSADGRDGGDEDRAAWRPAVDSARSRLRMGV
jgi:DNA-binding CsgD family transcriptional regulator